VKLAEDPLTLPVTLPTKEAVIVPAVKLPVPSLITSVPGVLIEAALPTSTVAAAIAEAVCPPTWPTTVVLWLPVTSPAKLPVKLIVVVELVDVEALPFKLAVIVPAAKLPAESLSTRELGTLLDVAVSIKITAAAIADADWPPTKLTVVVVAPGPVPETSPIRDVIAVTEPMTDRTPELFMMYALPSVFVKKSRFPGAGTDGLTANSGKAITPPTSAP
jgi:hypothetical protein